ILSGRGLELQDLAGIAVSGGPGSFTGLRIGLAWAKGVCLGLSLELTLVSEHEVNAYRHRQSPGLIATVLPGERGEAQAALWPGPLPPTGARRTRANPLPCHERRRFAPHRSALEGASGPDPSHRARLLLRPLDARDVRVGAGSGAAGVRPGDAASRNRHRIRL